MAGAGPCLGAGASLALVLVQAVGGHKPGRHAMPVVELEADSRTGARPDAPGSSSRPTESSESGREPPPPPRRKRTRKPAQKPTRKRTRNAKRRLGNVIDLVKRRGGKINASNRTLAKQLRLSKS